MKSFSNRITRTSLIGSAVLMLALGLIPAFAAADVSGGGTITPPPIDSGTSNPQTPDSNVSGGGTLNGNSPVSGGGTLNGNSPVSGGGTLSGKSESTFALTNPLKAKSIGEIVLDIIQIFSYIAILFGALAIIWVGFQYILASSQGNGDKIKELHGYFMAIIIGLAIVIGASAIIHILLNTLKATGTVNENIINSANKAAQFK